MISITRYRELLIEWMNSVNNQTLDRSIDGVAIAVREGHMVRKLRDRQGVWLCSNYPDAQVQHTDDNDSTVTRVLLYIIEKVPSGQMNDEREIMHYAQMQELMDLLVGVLIDNPSVCRSMVPESSLNVEWEYDIFGGWNGLSVSLTLRDYDSTIH